LFYYYYISKIPSFIDFSSWPNVVLGIVRYVIGLIAKKLRARREKRKNAARQQKEQQNAAPPSAAPSDASPADVINEEHSEELEQVTITRKRTRSRSSSGPVKRKPAYMSPRE
jgi:flagellar biosynthesis/type III secretory pathway M-ring protein FliF/YscJ